MTENKTEIKKINYNNVDSAAEEFNVSPGVRLVKI